MPRYGTRDSAGELADAGDLDLARRAAGGDRRAFAELARRAAPLAWSLLRRMGAQPALADDLTQDTMVAALRSIGTFRGDAQFASWTMKIAARLYLAEIRRNARLQLSAQPLDVETPEVLATSHATRIDLDNALLDLSAAERLCVSLCHGAGYTHEEIAAALQMPVGTSKSHVSRGLGKLRRRMLGEELPPGTRSKDDDPH